MQEGKARNTAERHLDFANRKQGQPAKNVIGLRKWKGEHRVDVQKPFTAI
jgi:hypothetical protein